MLVSIEDEEAPKSDTIVGAWKWFNGATLSLQDDGTFTGQLAEGAVSGRWKLQDAATRQYKLLWRLNDEVRGIDTVTLAEDGKALSGQDADGKAVSGQRQESTTIAPDTSPRTLPPTPPGGNGGTPNTFFPALNFALEIGQRGGKIVINSTANNPLAVFMELKVGDRVLKINGQSTEGMSEEKARTLVKESGASKAGVTLEILRESNGQRVTFVMPGTGTSSLGPDRPTVSEANQNQAAELLDKGAKFAEQEKWPQAEAEYRKALRLDPTRDDGWILLGEACLEQKKWDEAVVAYRELVKLAPESGANHADLAHALVKQGTRGEALREAREAMRLGEEEHPVFEELGLKPKG